MVLLQKKTKLIMKRIIFFLIPCLSLIMFIGGCQYKQNDADISNENDDLSFHLTKIEEFKRSLESQNVPIEIWTSGHEHMYDHIYDDTYELVITFDATGNKVSFAETHYESLHNKKYELDEVDLMFRDLDNVFPLKTRILIRLLFSVDNDIEKLYPFLGPKLLKLGFKEVYIWRVGGTYSEKPYKLTINEWKLQAYNKLN